MMLCQWEGDFWGSWETKLRSAKSLEAGRAEARKVTDSLGGRGIFVFFFSEEGDRMRVRARSRGLGDV